MVLLHARGRFGFDRIMNILLANGGYTYVAKNKITDENLGYSALAYA